MNYEEILREIINSNREYYPSEDKAVFAKYFPELKESEDERIRREIIDYINELEDLKNEKIPTKWLAWLEKQGEQTQLDYEHADIPQKDFAPIEPKFKVGDWVVNNICLPIQIASIKDGMYVFTKGDAMSVLFIDGNYHLMKDGVSQFLSITAVMLIWQLIQLTKKQLRLQ